MAAASHRGWFVEFAGLVALMFVFPNPIILLISTSIRGDGDLAAVARRNSPEAQEYYRVAPRHRVMVCIYLTLAALLVLGMAETHIERNFGDVSGLAVPFSERAPSRAAGPRRGSSRACCASAPSPWRVRSRPWPAA